MTTSGMAHTVPARRPNWRNRSEKMQRRTVFVGGLTARTTERGLKEYLEYFGTIDEVMIIRNENGVSKRFGFVTFEDLYGVTGLMSYTAPLILDGNFIEIRPYDFDQAIQSSKAKQLTSLKPTKQRYYSSSYGSSTGSEESWYYSKPTNRTAEQQPRPKEPLVKERQPECPQSDRRPPETVSLKKNVTVDVKNNEKSAVKPPQEELKQSFADRNPDDVDGAVYEEASSSEVKIISPIPEEVIIDLSDSSFEEVQDSVPAINMNNSYIDELIGIL